MSVFNIYPELKKTIPWKLVIIFTLFTMGILILGFFYYKSQQNRIFSEYQNNLSAIATLKIGQISHWHNERLGDAQVIKDNEPLINTIKKFFKDENQPEIRRELTKWMESIYNQYDYNGVCLIDTSLKERLSFSQSDSVSILNIRKELSDVMKRQKIVFTDLHRTSNIGNVHIDLLVPLIEHGSKKQMPFGILILRIDPDKVLFPLIQSWPTPSKSSETLLLRQDGDSVLYLNELRHAKNTALSLRLPLGDKRLLASKAIRGFEGVTEGVDYRKIPVVGSLNKISGTPWFMVAKVDKEEIQMPLKRYFFMIVIIIILLILINGSVFGFWIWDQRVKMYRLQLKDEIALRESEEKLHESEELFRRLFENMLNGFAYCKMLYEEGHPLNFLFIKVNDAFESLTGLKNVNGKKVSEVIPGIQEADPELLERYSRVALTGKPEVFETYVESLKMWFSISIYSPQKEYFVAVFDVITARKLAEEKLLETNEYLSNLFNYANAPIIVWDSSLLITRFNHAFEKLSGYNGEEVIGKRIDILFSKEENESALSLIDKTVSGERWETVDIEIQRKDGNSRTVLWNSANIHDKDGKTVIATIAQGHDITERKQAEETLRENDKRLREAQEMSHLGFWIWDIKTGNVEWSDEVYKIFCLDPQTFTPKIDSILELSPWPENNQRDKELIRRAVETHEPGTYEQKFLRPDKGIGYYYSTFRGNYDNNGDLISIVGTVLDITERKQAEEALRESEDKFKYVFDHSVIGKSITLPSGEINVNKSFCDMLGYSQEDLEKTKWQDISHPDDIETTEKIMHSLITGEKDSARFIKRFLHKNGSVIWTDVGTAIRRDENGKPLYFMNAINNITDRKMAEEALRELNEELELRVTLRTEQLEATNKELEAFSYSVSHDLRAPLRSVHSFTKILIEEYENKMDDEAKRICGIIASSATQMGELIDDLLSFSRIGRSNMNPSVIDMKKMAGLLFERMTSPSERERIKLKIGKLHNAYGDVTLLGQAWINLLSNAIKYSSKNEISEIFVGSSVSGEMITYYIKDNGVGFDMQYAHKLFGVFQRLHSESEFEGNGVGLAIVQRIILKHGGTVRAEGEIGKGATFYFTLPAAGSKEDDINEGEKRRGEGN